MSLDLVQPSPRYTGTATDVFASGRVAGESYDSIQIQADGTILLGDGTAAPVAAFDAESYLSISSAIEAFPRWQIQSNGVASATQKQLYTFFRPQVTMAINRVKGEIGGTIGVSLTLAKFAVFSVDGSGNGTLMEKTADASASWMSPATTFSAYSVSLLSEITLQRGQLYAAGWLFVGGTIPTQYGNSVTAGHILALAPMMASEKAGLADTPASFTQAGNANSSVRAWFYLDHS